MCIRYNFREKQKLSSLRESYGQLQRSYQHQEKDLGRRKERETELLSLTERLSSANAELQAERTSWNTKVWIQCGCVCIKHHTPLLSLPLCIPPFHSLPSLCVKQEYSLSEEVSELTSSLAQAQEARKTAESELTELREDTHSQISHLVESVEQKSKAGLLLRSARSSHYNNHCVCWFSSCSGAADDGPGGREGADQSPQEEAHEQHQRSAETDSTLQEVVLSLSLSLIMIS